VSSLRVSWAERNDFPACGESLVSALPSPAFDETLRRLFPRQPINVQVDLTVLQFGVPQNLPGRCTDISERGLGAVVAGELSAGQQVAIELRLPNVGVPVHARAVVRYQSRFHCGLELTGLSRDQQDMIRYWLYQSAVKVDRTNADRTTVEQENIARSRSSIQEEVKEPDTSSLADEQVVPAKVEAPDPAPIVKPRQKVRVGRRAFLLLAVLVLAFGTLGWWRWQQSWNDLEMQSAAGESSLRVSAETMGTRILTKVDPVYPEAARRLGTQGLVVLDAVIAPDGSVKNLRPLSGPDVLVQSASAAVGTWKFEPYLSSGKAVQVETTIAVEFRLD
jgi:protein TonB